MKRTIAISLVLLLLAVSFVSAIQPKAVANEQQLKRCHFSGIRCYIPEPANTGNTNDRSCDPAHKTRGAFSCFNGHENVPALLSVGGNKDSTCPGTNPKFKDCVVNNANHALNQGRDFDNALKHGEGWTPRVQKDNEFNSKLTILSELKKLWRDRVKVED